MFVTTIIDEVNRSDDVALTRCQLLFFLILVGCTCKDRGLVENEKKLSNAIK